MADRSVKRASFKIRILYLFSFDWLQTSVQLRMILFQKKNITLSGRQQLLCNSFCDAAWNATLCSPADFCEAWIPFNLWLSHLSRNVLKFLFRYCSSHASPQRRALETNSSAYCDGVVFGGCEISAFLFSTSATFSLVALMRNKQLNTCGYICIVFVLSTDGILVCTSCLKASLVFKTGDADFSWRI